ncbi:MAG: RluA family pseudouridine synthase [Clostridia bacterium]|nr:RluA family pseudouridine synthase [Clostridia bacterium]
MEETIFQAVGDGRRADVLLSEASGLSRSRIAALMAEGCCLAEGEPCRKAGTKTRPGQTLILRVPAPRPAQPQAEDLPLEILYQDEDLAVIVKPRGMVVHPAPGHEQGTLVNALLHHLDALGGIGGELRPGIVHRLDKDTSGVMLVARNDAAQTALSEMLAARRMEKHYRALVEGAMKEPAGRVELPIARSKKDRKKMAVDPEGREAVTEWRVLAEGRGCALLDVHILTGRTHQIRVHMRHLGHPVCGDPIYGWERGVRVPCLMLHAFSLAFDHPRTGERMTFRAPLPADFQEGLRKNGIDPALASGEAGEREEKQES